MLEEVGNLADAAVDDPGTEVVTGSGHGGDALNALVGGVLEDTGGRGYGLDDVEVFGAVGAELELAATGGGVGDVGEELVPLGVQPQHEAGGQDLAGVDVLAGRVHGARAVGRGVPAGELVAEALVIIVRNRATIGDGHGRAGDVALGGAIAVIADGPVLGLGPIEEEAVLGTEARDVLAVAVADEAVDVPVVIHGEGERVYLVHVEQVIDRLARDVRVSDDAPVGVVVQVGGQADGVTGGVILGCAEPGQVKVAATQGVHVVICGTPYMCDNPVEGIGRLRVDFHNKFFFFLTHPVSRVSLPPNEVRSVIRRGWRIHSGAWRRVAIFGGHEASIAAIIPAKWGCSIVVLAREVDGGIALRVGVDGSRRVVVLGGIVGRIAVIFMVRGRILGGISAVFVASVGGRIALGGVRVVVHGAIGGLGALLGVLGVARGGVCGLVEALRALRNTCGSLGGVSTSISGGVALSGRLDA